MAALAVLALSALALPAVANEDIQLVTLRSPAFHGERKVLVRTPPGYEGGDARYPVLYFTDGGGLLDPLDAAVRFLEGVERIPRLILVGIVHEDRVRELTPTRVDSPREDATARFPTSGGADTLLSFLEKELVPWVEKTYRTAPLRILAGHSFGGLFSLHVLAARPGLFRAHLLMSPSLHWDGDLPLRRIAELVRARPDLEATVVVASGDEGAGLERRIGDLGKALAAARQVAFRAFHLPGEDHGSMVFEAQYRGLQAIFEGWLLPVAEGDVGPRGGLAAVDAHYRSLSRRLGMEVTPPERVANLAAYQLLRGGDAEGSLLAFQSNVERYPASANVHDSLGEAYERTGDLDAALRCYAKAVDVAARNRDPRLPVFQRNLARARAGREARNLERGAAGR